MVYENMAKSKEVDASLQKNKMKCCPIDYASKIIEKRFTLLILRNMAHFNQSRFNQLIGSIEGMNPKTLSTRLEDMEKEQLITRQVYTEKPIKIEYSLTEKGHAMESILDQLASFSMQYYPKDIFKNGKAQTFQQAYGIPAKALR